MLDLTAESDSAEFLPTRTGRMPVPSCKYRRFEYGGLPVNSSGIMLSHNLSHPPRRVGHAGQASESRRQLVLAVALGCPFGMVNGEWRWLRRRSSTCRSRLCEGACRRETEALTCRSLALWPMPRTCDTTPSWCPRR